MTTQIRMEVNGFYSVSRSHDPIKAHFYPYDAILCRCLPPDICISKYVGVGGSGL